MRSSSSLGEIKLSFGAVEFASSSVVSKSGFMGSVEGAKPETSTTVGFANFGDPFAPSTLADAFESARSVVWSAFASHAALAGAGLSNVVISSGLSIHWDEFLVDNIMIVGGKYNRLYIEIFIDNGKRERRG